MEIMNLKMFLEEMDNDYEMVEMIVNQYIESLEKQLIKMKDLLGKDTHNGESIYIVISREAHSIKGGARNVMAPRLERVSKELEEKSATKDNNVIKKIIDELEIEYNAYKTFVLNNLINHQG